MRLRVVKVWLSLPVTSTARPFSGLPAVSSTTVVKFSWFLMLAQLATRRPATTCAGHRRRRCVTVCTSPLGSLKVSSAVRSEGAASVGSLVICSLAAPCRSVMALSLSATSCVRSLPASPPSSSSLLRARPAASKVKSS